MIDYHDREWGVPVHDDRRLFEKLCLEGFQSGLSWRTILAKRENYRRAFDVTNAAGVTPGIRAAAPNVSGLNFESFRRISFERLPTAL